MPNLKKLQKLVANIDGESLTSLTREELQEVLSSLIDLLTEANKKNRDELSGVVAKMGADMRQLETRISRLER